MNSFNPSANYAPFIRGSEENVEIRSAENINASWKYRKYLQDNATTIIDYNKNSVCNDFNQCNKYSNNQHSANIPFRYQSSLETTKPFGYQNSDLKEQYLAKQQNQSMKSSPELLAQVAKFFGLSN